MIIFFPAEEFNGTYPYYETVANGNVLIAQTTWDQTKEAVELSFVNSEFKFYFKEDGTLISDTVETNKLVLKQGDTLTAKQQKKRFLSLKYSQNINRKASLSLWNLHAMNWMQNFSFRKKLAIFTFVKY